MNNMYLDSFIHFLDARANIVIWVSEKEKLFFTFNGGTEGSLNKPHTI